MSFRVIFHRPLFCVSKQNGIQKDKSSIIIIILDSGQEDREQRFHVDFIIHIILFFE